MISLILLSVLAGFLFQWAVTLNYLRLTTEEKATKRFAFVLSVVLFMIGAILIATL
jgi:formate/nitrite transporter FocA (FNT family)